MSDGTYLVLVYPSVCTGASNFVPFPNCDFCDFHFPSCWLRTDSLSLSVFVLNGPLIATIPDRFDHGKLYCGMCDCLTDFVRSLDNCLTNAMLLGHIILEWNSERQHKSWVGKGKICPLLGFYLPLLLFGVSSIDKSHVLEARR